MAGWKPETRVMKRRHVPYAATSVLLLAALSAAIALAADKPRSATQPTSTKAAKKPPKESPGAAMEYGPFLSYSVLRPQPAKTKEDKGTKAPPSTAPTTLPFAKERDVLAVKGIVINVGNNASVIFDTDLCALSGGWTGGFLNFDKTNLGGLKGDFPASIRGTLQFSTRNTPGWMRGPNFEDPREPVERPLPANWAHYRGLYRNGQKGVL